MHKALHPKSNVDRLYISRNEGGRGLFSVEDPIETSKNWTKEINTGEQGKAVECS